MKYVDIFGTSLPSVFLFMHSLYDFGLLHCFDTVDWMTSSPSNPHKTCAIYAQTLPSTQVKEETEEKAINSGSPGHGH